MKQTTLLTLALILLLTVCNVSTPASEELGEATSVAPLIILPVPGFPGTGIEQNTPQALIYG